MMNLQTWYVCYNTYWYFELLYRTCVYYVYIVIIIIFIIIKFHNMCV